MKIAFIHPFFLRYARGIERYTANLASALIQAGARVDILTWSWPNPISWQELHPAVRVLTVPTFRYFSAWFVWPFYLMHLLRERYDHVFFYFADYGEMQTFNLLKSQVFSVVLHFPYSQVPHRYHTLTGSGLFERARHIMAVSEYVGREMQVYSRRTCAVIPHGVDASRFRPAPEARLIFRQSLGLDPDTPVILSVCALELRKGVQHVLRALTAIAREVPDVCYVVVGDGPDAEFLLQLARELELSDRTHFLPATPDVQACYQAADVFAIPARGEASSLVSLEALACELPVVASCRAPFDELIRPGWGYLVNEEDPADVAGVLTRLLMDADSRARMGRAGREYVLAYHNWNTVAARYLELLA